MTATVALAACNSSTTSPLVPSGTVTFTSPAGGENYQIGDTVELAWSCGDCANVPAGDYLEVLAFDGLATYLLDASGQMTDSTSWVVGSSLQSVELLPGTLPDRGPGRGGVLHGTESLLPARRRHPEARESAENRVGRGGRHGRRRPPTPPDVRFRIRRFMSGT